MKRGPSHTAGIALAMLGLMAAPSRAAEGTRMSAAKLKSCEPKSATLNLVNEALLTRAAITPETIDSVAPPVDIPVGDPRLAKLGALLRGLALEPAKLPQFELKMRVTVECVDGSSLVVLGSPTGQDGRLDLAIDGEAASTRQPLRKELEALAK